MRNSGKIVEVKSGKIGRTFDSYGLINGKVPVYLDGEAMPILCNLETLKIIGFID